MMQLFFNILINPVRVRALSVQFVVFLNETLYSHSASLHRGV